MYLPSTQQPGMSGIPQPGTGMSDLMQLMKLQAPQSPMGGAQFGGGQLPGLPPGLPGAPTGGGMPPNPQMNKPEAREKVTSALLQGAGNKLGQSGSPGGSALGGALQGASLAGQVTGKSPLTALKNMMAPQSPGGSPNPLTDPIAGNSDMMSFMNELSGMPADPAREAGMAEAAKETASIEMQQAYLDALSPKGVDELFTMAPGAGAEAGEAGMAAGELGGELGAGLGGMGAGAEAAGLGEAGITAAELGLGGAELAPAIPAALEGGAALGGAEAAAAGAAGLGPVGWGGLGIAGLLALLGDDIF